MARGEWSNAGSADEGEEVGLRHTFKWRKERVEEGRSGRGKEWKREGVEEGRRYG